MLPPADPKANYLAHRQEIDQAIRRVLESGWYILGSEVAAFEREFARYLGAAHCVSVANGTEALQVALLALGIGPGQAVITVSHTAVATVSAIDLCGATPVLVDIDPATFCMDPGKLEDTIKAHRGLNIKAIIPVHLYGHPADLDPIMAVARQHGLAVIEDCSQAHGALYHDRKVGTTGVISTFSFYPTKNLGALGDGGAVATDDAALAQRCRLIRQYGWEERYISDIPGMNSRLDELQAAVLRVKLNYLDRENDRRRELAQEYQRSLASCGLALPAEYGPVRHVYHQFAVQSGRRDDLKKYLADRGVGSTILYPSPVHLQPGYRDRVKPGAGGLANTEAVCRQVLSLPLYPELGDEQAGRVTAAVRAWGDSPAGR